MVKLFTIFLSILFVTFGFILGVTYTKYKGISVNTDDSNAGRFLANRGAERSAKLICATGYHIQTQLTQISLFAITEYLSLRLCQKTLQNTSLTDRHSLQQSYRTHIQITKKSFLEKNDTQVHEQRSRLKGSECRSFDENIHKNTYKYAYYFYAATSQYLCGAKVLRAQVIALDGVKADFVLSIAPNMESEKSRLEADGWRVLPVCNLPGPNGMYSATLHKIRAFHLLQYDRVIYMDTDMSIVRSIHHVFEMPHTPLIGAWSYWDDRPTITGPFWAASPSMTLWYKLWENFHKRQNENQTICL